MFCQECGVEARGGKFCSSCGVELNQSAIENIIQPAEPAASPSTQVVNHVAPNKGTSVSRIIGLLLFVPAALLAFPAFTFLTDGNCHWVTATQDLSPVTLFTGNALYCMYSPDEYSARAEAYYMGLAPDTVWMSNSAFLILVGALIATSLVLIKSGKK